MILEDPALLLDDRLSQLVIDQSFPIPISSRKFLENASVAARRRTRQYVFSQYSKKMSILPVKEIIREISSSSSCSSDGLSKYVRSISQMLQRDIDLASPIIQRYEFVVSSIYRHTERYLSIFMGSSMVELDITSRYRQKVIWKSHNSHKGEENQQINSNIQPPEHEKLSCAIKKTKACHDDPENFTELCVNALCTFSTGEMINNITGFLHEVSIDDLAQLEACNSNFSVLETISNRERFHVLLGPARFINHDCNPNVKFVKKGHEISIQAIRPIKLGEEILVSYGISYFETNNSGCLCRTCERNGKFQFATNNCVAKENGHIYKENLEYLLRPRRLRADIFSDPIPVQQSGHSTDAIGCPWRSASFPSTKSKSKLCETCKIRFSDYGRYLICERCNRHWQTYGCYWPLKFSKN